MQRKLTGTHVATIFVGAFAVIIAVNVTMAVNAVKTFPGLETRNTYVASQRFDRDRAAQNALGWQAQVHHDGARLVVSFTTRDMNLVPVEVTGILGRPTAAVDDIALVFVQTSSGFVAETGALSPGRWQLRLQALSGDGTVFRQRIDVPR